MAIVSLKNAYKDNASDVIGINTDKIISIYETIDPLDPTNNRIVTIIYCGPELSFSIQEPIADVIIRINKVT